MAASARYSLAHEHSERHCKRLDKILSPCFIRAAQQDDDIEIFAKKQKYFRDVWQINSKGKMNLAQPISYKQSKNVERTWPSQANEDEDLNITNDLPTKDLPACVCVCARVCNCKRMCIVHCNVERSLYAYRMRLNFQTMHNLLQPELLLLDWLN